MPSNEVDAITRQFGNERRVMKGSLLTYKDKWQLLGKISEELTTL